MKKFATKNIVVVLFVLVAATAATSEADEKIKNPVRPVDQVEVSAYVKERVALETRFGESEMTSDSGKEYMKQLAALKKKSYGELHRARTKEYNNVRLVKSIHFEVKAVKPGMFGKRRSEEGQKAVTADLATWVLVAKSAFQSVDSSRGVACFDMHESKNSVVGVFKVVSPPWEDTTRGSTRLAVTFGGEFRYSDAFIKTIVDGEILLLQKKIECAVKSALKK